MHAFLDDCCLIMQFRYLKCAMISFAVQVYIKRLACSVSSGQDQGKDQDESTTQGVTSMYAMLRNTPACIKHDCMQLWSKNYSLLMVCHEQCVTRWVRMLSSKANPTTAPGPVVQGPPVKTMRRPPVPGMQFSMRPTPTPTAAPVALTSRCCLLLGWRSGYTPTSTVTNRHTDIGEEST